MIKAPLGRGQIAPLIGNTAEYNLYSIEEFKAIGTLKPSD